ncbi:MAG: hypothetical protein IIB56_03340 [Planctomycetes bacterium]|nr:hypothetical protein [Planctomycetota bacterium]
MKLDYLKEKKELVSVVLHGVSAFLAVLILVKVTGFFTAPAKAELLVKKAVAQNNAGAEDVDKYFAKYKALANELKKNNLFAPPAAKQHPVKEVWGIFGNEVLIKDKWYKIDDTVGDAKIVAIGPTEVTIEWDGKEKTFAPIDSKSSSQPGGSRGSRGSRATASSGGPGGGRAEMVTIRSEGRPMGRPEGGRGSSRGGMERFIGGMRERFQNMPEADRDRFRAEMQERRGRYMNMSEAEREKFRAEMRERFGGGRSGGGRPSGGERGSGGSRGSGGGRRGGR